MLQENQVISAIAIAIEDANFNIDSTTENTENWDSLGVLSIVTTLSKLTGGESDAISELASVDSAADLIMLLRESNLVE